MFIVCALPAGDGLLEKNKKFSFYFKDYALRRQKKFFFNIILISFLSRMLCQVESLARGFEPIFFMKNELTTMCTFRGVKIYVSSEFFFLFPTVLPFTTFLRLNNLIMKSRTLSMIERGENKGRIYRR